MRRAAGLGRAAPSGGLEELDWVPGGVVEPDLLAAMSQQRLGARQGVDRTTMVAVVDQLERNRLVARRRNPDDRRAYSLHATPAGRRALEQANQAVEGAEDEFLAGLYAADRRRLKNLLRTLIAP